MAWRPRLVSMPIIFDDLAPPTDEFRRGGPSRSSRRGRACGRTRSAKRAITSASSDVGLGQAAHRAGEVSGSGAG